MAKAPAPLSPKAGVSAPDRAKDPGNAKDDTMSPHAVNSLVTDLVQMAQAMEKVPQLEAELNDANNVISTMTNEIETTRRDLWQVKDYAATLEQKVKDLEVSRDDAELRFLELDEKAGHAIGVLNQIMGYADSIQSQVRDAKDMIHPPQPEPIISEVKPIAANPTLDVPTPTATIHSAPAPIDPQGQSEADPTVPMDGQSTVSDVSIATQTAFDTTASRALPTPPDWAQDKTDTSLLSTKPQPYAGKRYIDVEGWVSYDNWIANGGTYESYWAARV